MVTEQKQSDAVKVRWTKKRRALEAVSRLAQAYPDALCSLEYEKPHELLIATRLAAQCTDERVNMVCPALFARFPTIEAFAEGPLEDIEELIKTCGLYKTKAKDIFAMCRKLRDDFGSQVPGTMEELTSLPGIGRKTANLILGDIFRLPGSVVVDTHCIRLTNLLGLVETKDPGKVETELRRLLPPEESNDFCHRLVLHGRAVCVARRPNCLACVLLDICKTKPAADGIGKGSKTGRKSAKKRRSSSEERHSGVDRDIAGE